ncbi:MAG: phosphatidylglycerophosphatase A [Balneolaceae bacterium]|nr:phosphatidylglycerophosphatase A [Balneolaceae bacterium]
MNIRVALGTLFGAGHLPVAPGTWGSLFTLPLIYLASFLFPTWGIPAFFVASILLSLYCAPAVEAKYGHDPSQFVMDECAGQSLVFILGGFSYTFFGDLFTLIFGFLLFRFFDVLKPLGIDKLQKLPGEIGILADDLLAGVYAFICLEGCFYIYHTLL